MNISVSNIVRLAFLALSSGAFLACNKVGDADMSSESQKIAFYVKAQPQVKGIVEDTQDLVAKAPKLVVTEDGTGTAFQERTVNHTANGVWRSDVQWENRPYSLFAYVKSEGNANLGCTISVDPNSDGRTVSLTEPRTYSDNPNDYTDYLLSYRASVDGSQKPLVRLELERVTTGVELYVTAAPNMTNVKLISAEFENIYRAATFNIAYHATNTDPVVDGLKNRWAVKLSQSKQTGATYTYTPRGGKVLQKYNPDAGRFAPENRVMRFLTVQQNLLDNATAILKLTYTSEENGVTREYSSSFKLSDYSVKTWNRGHKVRYYVSIDTGAKLEGTIEPWKTVDYIEGTFLPK